MTFDISQTSMVQSFSRPLSFQFPFGKGKGYNKIDYVQTKIRVHILAVISNLHTPPLAFTPSSESSSDPYVVLSDLFCCPTQLLCSDITDLSQTGTKETVLRTDS